jgi:hypothetical protein
MRLNVRSRRRERTRRRSRALPDRFARHSFRIGILVRGGSLLITITNPAFARAAHWRIIRRIAAGASTASRARRSKRVRAIPRRHRRDSRVKVKIDSRC